MPERPGTSSSERVYRALLRLYPRRFREEYGQDALELFLDQVRATGSRPSGLARLWLRTVPNLLLHGLLERITEHARRATVERGAGMRAAARSLRRSPGLAVAVVLTLGVGIGANVALFAVLEGVLLRPLPYPEADRLVRLWETNPDVDAELHGPSPLNFADWAERASGFEAMAAWYLTSGTYRTAEWAEEIRSAQVSVDFFRVLGVEPMIGRDFRPEEVVRYGPLMLSHDLWRRRFGRDSTVVGRTIVSSNLTYEIVGVMPPGFSFPDPSVEAWIGWNLPSVYADRPETRTWRFLGGVGRLAPGVTPQAGEAELDGVATGLADAYPEADGGWDTAVTSLHDDTVGSVRATLWVAFGSVLFILLIACANVANLLLSRAPERIREIGIRTTLGAGRGRIARELLAEYLLLALAAGALGLLLGQSLLTVVTTLEAGRIPRLSEVSIDVAVFAFTAGVAALTSVGFGLAPAVHLLRGSAARSGHGRRTTAGIGHVRLREGFVAGQVAIALILLTSAGLFYASLGRIMDVDPGLDPADVATFRVSLDPVDGTDGEIARYYAGLVDRLEEVPGVVAAGASQTLPLNPVGNDFRRPWRRAGTEVASADAPTVQMRIVTPGYMDAVGMRVLQGSAMPDVRADDPLVAIVNETLARRLSAAGNVVGAPIEIDFREGWRSYRIVGVVQDVRHYGLRSEAAPEVFLPHAQVPYLAMSLAVRTRGDPAAMTEALRSAVVAHVPMQPPHAFVSLEELVADSMAEERFLSTLLALLALVALGLAATGVFGVIAYTVSHRRREIGVRLALGAEPGQVVGAVLRGAARTTFLGMVVGLVLVALLGRAVEGLLYGVAPTDPSSHVAAALVLLCASALAAWLPARRAATVPPVEALRSD